MDAGILAAEAQKLHAIFQNAFYVMMAAFLLVAVVLEFLKLPIGDSPVFTTLVGRCLIAAFLLLALPHIMDFIASATDSIANQIGNLNNFKLVLHMLGKKLESLSFSWTSFRDIITILISFLSFFLLYITVYFADAAFMFCWVLIYVFSPIIFALYIFPRTAGATTALFRSIIEVSLWKLVWCCMATLLWSAALSNINQPNAHINWLTAIVWNLMLMVSVLMTPKLVHALLSGGIAEFAGGAQGAVMGAASLTPAASLGVATSSLLYAPKKAVGFAKNQVQGGVSRAGAFAKDTVKERLPDPIRRRFIKPESPITKPRKS